jgi:hypothetical protein
MVKEPITFEYGGTRFTAEVVERDEVRAAGERRADLFVRVADGPRQRVGSVHPELPRRDAEGLVVEWYDGF